MNEYTYIAETSYVPREYSVAAILLLQFMMLVSSVSVSNLLYFYISTFRSMCAVRIIIITIVLFIIFIAECGIASCMYVNLNLYLFVLT